MRDGTRYKHNFPPSPVYIAGENMDLGAAVCQSKNSKDRIMMADANDEARMPCIGALLESKLLGQEALVVPFGMFPNLRRTEDFQPGDEIWVSATRGYFTRTQPVSGTLQVVGKARNENSGLLYCVPPQIPVSYGYAQTGNHTILTTDLDAEKTFAADGDADEFSCWHHGMLWCEFDLSTLAGEAPITVVGRLYHMIDGANLKPIDTKVALIGSDEDHMTLCGAVSSGKTIQLSLQVDKAAGVSENRAIPHVFIQDS